MQVHNELSARGRIFGWTEGRLLIPEVTRHDALALESRIGRGMNDEVYELTTTCGA